MFSTRRKRKKIFKKFEKTLFKFAPAALLIIGILTFNVYSTNAYFNDIENSIGNNFSAGILDINISGRNISGIVNSGNATTTTITLSKSNPANLNYQYFASSTILDTDQTACDYIAISASSSPQIISSPLKNFISFASAPIGPVQWDFTFTATDSIPSADLGKICNFKISYIAWQTNLPNSLQGFSDVAEIDGSIQIGTAPTVPIVPDVVLNEFLPNPIGNDSADAPDGEWVELYNNSSTNSFDLSSWYIRDASATGKVDILLNNTYDFSIHASSTIIAPKGWLVVYMNKEFLNNSGTETITLFNSSGVQQDFYSYASSGVPINKSFARIPDGTGAWVDPIPTPGGPNKAEEILGGSSSEVALDILVVETSTSTEPIATSTENIIGDLVATTTPEIIAETASITPEIAEPVIIPPEPEIISEVVDEPIPESIIETPVIIEPETI
ncbi:MAG: lamin tail domain-containing protein [Patescibacteria group bacterium]